MLHSLVVIWFNFVRDWHYLGVMLLMAMESSIFPVPSEVVMPPAAYWASQGQMSFPGVILAGTVGSYIGSAITYWVAQWLGRPFLHRFGRFFLINDAKVDKAERWLHRHGRGGIFFARLLPVVRHLISIPAGILRMPFGVFSLMTIVGAGLWCGILAWFGREVLGEEPALLADPNALVKVLKKKLILIVGGVVLLTVAYVVMQVMSKDRTETKDPGERAAS